MALEIGASKNGGLSLWLAAHGMDVVCSTYRQPIAPIRSIHESHGVLPRLSYVDLDCRSMPFRPLFDVVCAKSVLGAIKSLEAQRHAIQEMHDVLRPGGELWIVENMRATRLHTWLRSKLGPGGRSGWRYPAYTELPKLFAPFGHFEYETTGVVGALGRSPRQCDLLARFDERVLNHVSRAGDRYIAMCFAKRLA